MPPVTRRNKLESIHFFNPPFRKLSNTVISFADRITVIAGHNGIGKSTILGLVANTFGLTGRSSPKSYFGEPFYASIERIVFLDMSEVERAQKDPASAPIVRAAYDGLSIGKRCAMTHRSEWQRARVVPRTVDSEDQQKLRPSDAQQEGDLGNDAKIPLPVIFLGVKRLASVGEAAEEDVASKAMSMHAEDKELLADFVRSVIVGSDVTTDITHQSIKGSGKKTAQPGYVSHAALAISMGQDSLGSIGTALASFNKLKRDQGDDYHGGLLIIDELDVGFHPHAIDRLTRSLKTYGKRLDLQIVVTTHSPRLIEAIHPDGSGDARSPDKVIYLVDTRHPRLAEDQSLEAVLADMSLIQNDDAPVKIKKPALCVYFEDAEGAQFCNALISAYKRGVLGRKYGVHIKLVPLGVGGSNLIGLPDMDPIFKDRVLIVDADTPIPKKATQRGNTIKLPCVKGAGGTDRSPENTIKKFLRGAAGASDGALYEAMLSFNVKNPSSDKILSSFFDGESGASNNREGSKTWWKDHWTKLVSWGVLEQWARCYPEEVKGFVTNFEAAVASTARRIT
ncbi:AAA family ATPase [Janthinobacterium sp. BJB304]|uniref:AAA family ATPase n=1 Tax=Janthinobacterium sp. BJB304 TaxID=1572871 RepID=UPI000C0CD31A|nr:AAA family ATPase [Janthinobacterium sp. BJB304]PHV36919.1 AAA family ATPase [Janthinobacterium sp. BJB304]